MQNILCLVVCEGSTDFVLIDEIIKHVGSTVNKKIEANLVYPPVDSTSGNVSQGGWSGVQTWCKQNATQRQSGQDRVGALLAFTGAAFIIIHLDTDIAHLLEVNGQKFTGSLGQRRGWCKRALGQWLGIYARSARIRYVLPTKQIETWILATFDEDSKPDIFPKAVKNYQRIEDVEARLLGLGYEEDSERPGRIYKQATIYRDNPRYAQRVIENFGAVKGRCKEARKFFGMVSAAISETG